MSRLALLALLCLPTTLSAATLFTSDGECRWRATYDPATTDRARLQATLDYLAGPEPLAEPGPPLTEPDEVAAIDLPAHRAECADRRAKLADARLLDLPDVEAMRQRELAALDDACAMNQARLAAAKGDLTALRTYAPAAACGRWVTALETPVASLRAAYDERLADLCQGSTAINICMDHLQKESEKAPRETRMRLTLLREGWARCAGGHLVEDDGKRRRSLRDAIFRRFKAKAVSCAQ